ncbi:MAG: SDR family NAD(P)-dependent oxidoreductase [Promethearchaeota archaeon]
MDLGVKGKVAIVTGGASGIGQAAVELFVKMDMKVIIVDFDDELGFKLEKRLQEEGFDVKFYVTDITNSEQINSMITQVINQYGTVDILINCAGVSGLSSYLDLIEEEWDWTINTNLKGTHLMCLAVAKIMVEKRIKGRILIISSINDQIPVVGLSAYTTSKAAITGLSRSLALELAPYGINVNTVRPAAIDTPMMKEILDLPDLAQALLRQIPRGRIGRPEDVAKVILFLVSDLAEWVTGAEIPVAGGMQLVGETSYNYYFEREMQHEDQLPDIPFTRPWKKYELDKFRQSLR